MTKKTFAVMGCGFLGNIVAKAWKDGLLEGYELIGAYSRKPEDARKLLEDAGAVISATEGSDEISSTNAAGDHKGEASEAASGSCQAKVCQSLEDLIQLKADFLVETASVALLKEVCIPALNQGTSVVPLSIGAFADQDFYEKAQAAAAETGAKIYIPSGAVGGFDVLQTVALMAEAAGKEITAGISTRKGPKSLQNTPLFEDSLMTEECDRQVFAGTAREAIALLPTKVNVAVATALASVGPETATAAITSVPGMTGDDHKITAKMEGIDAVVDIYSASSAIAGWSVVALLRNLASSVCFF